MADERTGTMTFLFTDIEGSTRRWEDDPEAMTAALAAHDEVLRTAIARHDGELFKHTGDGVCAIFHLADDAIAAAIEAQQRLELPVRMGMASGQAQARGGDYFGPALNRAARVMSAGHGGQILLAESSAALVDSSDYLDLGPHMLRDVNTPIRLTQVTGAGLGIDFAPLRTVDALRGNLTAAASPIVGRAEQIAQSVDTVRGHRLVTLTGAGGIGKTRLALEIAREVVDDFPDGAWVVELASTNESASVPALVANLLNVAVGPNTSRTESILTAIGSQKMLILLDNCEHVLDGVRELADAIIRNTDEVTIIATSRESLGIDGEQQWPVPPLQVGSGSDSEAVTLFLERAQAVNPTFDPAPGSDELAAVARICSELDGLALAIELAAARTVSMIPQDIADRLNHRFRLLKTLTSKTNAPHHRGLRETVAWSYELLDDDERSLLSQCAVFASGFDLESALLISQNDSWDEYVVLDLLESLIRKSLLVVETGRAKTRYRMLETIRRFAEEQLDASGSTQTVRRAHAERFAARAEEEWDRWDSPAQRVALDWADTEFAELRAGFRWAAEDGDVELAARIASHTVMLSFVLERFEPVRWVEEILEPSAKADGPQLPRTYTAACVCALVGGHQAAIDRALVAIRLETEPDRDPFATGWSQFWEAIGHRYLGDIERYLKICEELSGETGLAKVMGRCGLLGVLAGVGRQDEARAIADEVVREAEAHGNPFWIAWARASWGRAHASENPAAALGTLRACLEYAEGYRLDYIRAIILREIATLEGKHGGLSEALDMFRTVVEAYRVSGNRASAATALGDIAVMLQQLHLPEEAATVYGASQPLGFSIAEHLPPVIDQLREELGDTKFADCVGTGSALEFGEAMTYTRRVLDDVAEQFEANT